MVSSGEIDSMQLTRFAEFDASQIELTQKLLGNNGIVSALKSGKITMSSIASNISISKVNPEVVDVLLSNPYVARALANSDSLGNFFKLAQNSRDIKDIKEFFNDNKIKEAVALGANIDDLQDFYYNDQNGRKMINTLLKNTTITNLISEGTLSLSDIISAPKDKYVGGKSRNIPADNKMTTQLIKALENETIIDLLKSKKITFDDILQITDFHQSKYYYEYSFQDTINALENPNVLSLIKDYNMSLDSAHYASKMSDEQIANYMNAIDNSNFRVLGFQTRISKIQSSDEYKIESVMNATDPDFGTDVCVYISVNKDGIVSYSRDERRSEKNVTSSVRGSNIVSSIFKDILVNTDSGQNVRD